MDHASLLVRLRPIVDIPVFLQGEEALQESVVEFWASSDCSPQLHYETFVGGEFDDQVDAYVGGIRTTSSLLTKFGVSPVEIEEFEHLLEAVATTAKSMKV